MTPKAQAAVKGLGSTFAFGRNLRGLPNLQRPPTSGSWDCAVSGGGEDFSSSGLSKSRTWHGVDLLHLAYMRRTVWIPMHTPLTVYS